MRLFKSVAAVVIVLTILGTIGLVLSKAIGGPNYIEGCDAVNCLEFNKEETIAVKVDIPNLKGKYKLSRVRLKGSIDSIEFKVAPFEFVPLSFSFSDEMEVLTKNGKVTEYVRQSVYPQFKLYIPSSLGKEGMNLKFTIFADVTVAQLEGDSYFKEVTTSMEKDFEYRVFKKITID